MSIKWDQKKKNQIGTFQNKANITCQNGIINNSMQGVHWIFNFNICTKNHSIRTKEIASLSSWRQRAISLQLEINSILWQSVNSYAWLGIFPNSRIILNLKRKYIYVCVCVCVCVLIYCIGVFLSDLLHFCVIGSSFIHLIKSDSNAFFLIAE